MGNAVNLTSQADTPRLTLVSSVEPSLRQPSEDIEPTRFLQAITASLDLEQVLSTLNDFLHDLVGHSGWEYQHADAACRLEGGNPDRHRLEYALTLNGQEMGALKLMRGRRFSETDQARIEGLLGLAASALHNALRFYALTQQLERDPLTGLGNRRALTLQGGQWLADSIRHKQPLSMLVMDLDRFKAVNDTYGDEFVVLLPGTGLADALECAERIRQAVAKLALIATSGDPVKTSVSIGVATHRHGMDLDHLYHQADDALYAAKRAGCKRVLAGAGHADGERKSEPLGMYG